ncbi:hypothetical protein BDC45DRAFT_312067 [Circinella umbellata]|nr:hypothetical protein BDC45DRAFT_312067 [Circinella umbellata]
MTDTSRSLGEIEQDIVKINETLATISEVRSALKDFTSLVLQETKGPNYVHAFSDRLNHVKRGLNRLAAESEVLKGIYTLHIMDITHGPHSFESNMYV